MQLLRRRWFVVLYWLAALVVSILAGVAAAEWSVGAAESDDPAQTGTNGAQLVYGAVGFVLGLLGVFAVFTGIWLALWAANRRREADQEHLDYDDDGDFADLLDEQDDQDDSDGPAGPDGTGRS